MNTSPRDTMRSPEPDSQEAAADPVLPAAPHRQIRITDRGATLTDAAVGQRIRELRLGLRLSQRAVAVKLGITTAQMHRYEVGATRVAASRLLAIAEALDVRPGDLIHGKPTSGGSETTHDAHQLMVAFAKITSPRHRAALLQLANAMGGRDE